MKWNPSFLWLALTTGPMTARCQVQANLSAEALTFICPPVSPSWLYLFKHHAGFSIGALRSESAAFLIEVAGCAGWSTRCPLLSWQLCSLLIPLPHSDHPVILVIDP